MWGAGARAAGGGPEAASRPRGATWTGRTRRLHFMCLRFKTQDYMHAFTPITRGDDQHHHRHPAATTQPAPPPPPPPRSPPRPDPAPRCPPGPLTRGRTRRPRARGRRCAPFDVEEAAEGWGGGQGERRVATRTRSRRCPPPPPPPHHPRAPPPPPPPPPGPARPRRESFPGRSTRRSCGFSQGRLPAARSISSLWPGAIDTRPATL
jgi:hypothetical protein